MGVTLEGPFTTDERLVRGYDKQPTLRLLIGSLSLCYGLPSWATFDTPSFETAVGSGV